MYAASSSAGGMDFTNPVYRKIFIGRPKIIYRKVIPKILSMWKAEACFTNGSIITLKGINMALTK